MEKSEFRVLIKHYFLRKKTITQTKEILDKYYGDSAPSISMVKKWFTEFRCGRTSTSDAERSGRPTEVVTPEIVDKIHGMILDDQRMKVRELAQAAGISTERVHHILHEYLNMEMVSARWVPRLLTYGYKRDSQTPAKRRADGDAGTQQPKVPKITDDHTRKEQISRLIAINGLSQLSVKHLKTYLQDNNVKGISTTKKDTLIEKVIELHS